MLVDDKLAKEKLIHEIDILGNVYAVAKITIMNLIRNTDLTDCQQQIKDCRAYFGQGRGLCDMCFGGHYEQCRFVVPANQQGVIAPAPDQGSVRNATDELEVRRYRQARTMQIHFYGDHDPHGAYIYHSGTSLDAVIDAAIRALPDQKD